MIGTPAERDSDPASTSPAPPTEAAESRLSAIAERWLGADAATGDPAARLARAAYDAGKAATHTRKAVRVDLAERLRREAGEHELTIRRDLRTMAANLARAIREREAFRQLLEQLGHRSEVLPDGTWRVHEYPAAIDAQRLDWLEAHGASVEWLRGAGDSEDAPDWVELYYAPEPDRTDWREGPSLRAVIDAAIATQAENAERGSAASRPPAGTSSAIRSVDPARRPGHGYGTAHSAPGAGLAIETRAAVEALLAHLDCQAAGPGLSDQEAGIRGALVVQLQADDEAREEMRAGTKRLRAAAEEEEAREAAGVAHG